MSRSTRSITAGIAVFAALTPAASAMSPDGPLRTSATAPAVPHGHGIRTSSLAGTTSPTRVDLRSPDARDAASNRYLGTGHVQAVALPSASVATSDGFDWTDAAIGAGGGFGALVLVAGSAAALRRRARHSLA